jgi:hypothetical protein
MTGDPAMKKRMKGRIISGIEGKDEVSRRFKPLERFTVRSVCGFKDNPD